MARPIDIESRIAALSPAMRGLLRRRLARADPGDVVPMSISRRPDPDVAPLSYSQERVWFLSRIEPENPVTNRPFALRHRGPLETGILERVLNKIMERHEILRATVAEREGIPVQNIAPALSVRLPLKDFRKIPLSEKFDQVGVFAGEEARKPFDLSIGPLLRATLLRLDAHDHIFLVVVHHLLFDGWSAKIFTREIETLYADFIANRTPSLPDLPIQYADYAHWQRVGFDSGRMTPHLAYWKEALDNAPPELLLPTDRPRTGAGTWGGVQRSCLLPPTLTASLRDIGNRDGATLFMVLLAAFNVLLYRYSNQEDIVLGTPVAGRIAPETENLIGFFVNTLVLRNDLSGNPSFRQFLGRVKQTVIDAISHQEAPFEKVVEELNPDREMRRSPLFQVLFNFENFLRWEKEAQSSAWEEFEFDPEVAPFDLDLEITEKDGGLFCKLTVNRALFNAETAKRMLGHYATLLAGIAETPDRILSDLPLMTEPERRQILVEWNATEAAYPQDKCIHQLFEEQAARNPDSVAVTFGDSQLTYGELNVRANRLAHHLIRLGVGPDLLVAVGLERSIELIVGLLAILKAGGAYVPLDPEYPDVRLAHMLNDCAPVALITQTRLKEKWNRFASGIPVIELDSGAGVWSGCSIVNPDSGDLGLASHHLAYVIYTSGSTGTPKGVMVTHYNVVRLFKATEAWFSFNDRDVWTLFHSYSFDFSVWEIWGALFYGGRLVVVPRETSRSPQDFYRLLCQEKVTILNQTPGAFRQLVAAQSGMPQSHFLHKVIFGGEVLDVATLRPWYERNDPHRTELVNMYGITETTVHTTYRPLQPSDIAHRGGSPIGVRIPDLRIYILDSHGHPVPIGVTGELYVGGAGVARGYLNRPDLTAERFLPNPFSEGADARIYKTGDLGRWFPDGSIEFMGRNDFQIKIRGFRIELGEIEACLISVAGVREAVVLVREDIPGDKRLVAYYTVKDATVAPALDTLRGHLACRLPDHMLPSAYVAMDRFPLTQNGKTDRKALPAPDADAYATRPYEPPVGDLEKTLARIWSKLLGVEKISRRDHFFDLGGHSFLAVKMIAMLDREELHADVRALFMTPTLMDLAAAIQKVKAPVEVPPNLIFPGCVHITPDMLPLVSLVQGDIDKIVEATPGGAANIQDIYTLAPLQEGILFHHLMSGQCDAYLLLSLMAVDNRELLNGFLSALQDVINRHDILRTAVLWEGLSEPVQVVWRKASLMVEEVAVDPDAGDAEGWLRSRYDRNRYRIDIRDAPMMRAFIAHDDRRGRWLLALLYHHMAVDHTTMEILDEEIRVHLAGKAHRLPPALPFRNLVAQVRLGVGIEEHETFFRRMLEDVNEPTAPFGLMDVRGDGTDITETRLPLDLSLALRLREQARMLGVSTASVFHLAWARVLAGLCGSDDVVFGTVLFGRMQGGTGADRIMGVYINTLPVRIRIDNEAVEQAVRKTHRILAELLYHEHAPLALAHRCSAVPASMPLFSSIFNYRYAHAQSLLENEISLRDGIRLIYSEERTNYPVAIAVDDLAEEGFALVAQTRQPVDPMRVCKFLETAVVRLLETLEQAPESAIRSVDFLPPAERRQVLVEWNATEAAYPQDKCIHQLFEEQVFRTPDNEAVVFDDQMLTYRELNRRANQVAHHLIRQGVGPEVLVGVCMERSLEMVVGLLGILKAGGAYVPLDPAYPAERLSLMVDDARIRLILSQSHLRPRIPECHGRFIFLDGNETVFRAEVDDNPASPCKPDNLAYVIFTSGSTGKPKGVAVEHASVAALIAWSGETYSSAQLSGVLASSSICFDISVFELFSTLCLGGKVVLVKNLLDLPEMRHADQVTLINTVPSAFEGLLQLSGIPKSVGTVNLAGEPLHGNLVQAVYSNDSVEHVFNIYGPTEDTVYSTIFRAEKQGGTSLPIGRPIANSRAYVLDGYGQPVPVGVPGELYLGGAGLARGYLNRPGLTEEKFIPDPFSDGEGARLYRTGDLVQYRPDGNLVFLRRMDHQVKLRGFRIELGEVEAVLETHPRIRSALAVVREDTPGDKRLVAYTVPSGKNAPDDEELRDYLRQKLPDYMLPAAFIMIAAIPMMPNGKVNRAALPVPGLVVPSDTYIAPRTPVENAVAEIYRSVLKLDRIGIHDNFFDLGGHSLLATKVIAKIRYRFDIDLPLRSIFEATTVAGLSIAITRNQIGSTAPEDQLTMLDELDDMSDEEALNLLKAEIED